MDRQELTRFYKFLEEQKDEVDTSNQPLQKEDSGERGGEESERERERTLQTVVLVVKRNRQESL